MRRVYDSIDPKTKKRKQKVFDTDKSIYLCNTPDGKLYRKKNKVEFFIWKDGTNNPYIVSWADANNYVKTYGTREQYIQLFTAFDKSTTWNKGKGTNINIDAYHRIKVERNAERLHLSMQAYIYRLIDRDDDNHNYCK